VNVDTRASFLNVAGLVQGGLLIGSLLLAWLLDVQLWDRLHWSWRDCGWGLLATLPMLVVLVLAGNLRRLAADLLGHPLTLCTWYDLILLAILAGISEELLFRGVLTESFGRLHPWAGLIVPNVLFALAHALTPSYALIAAAFGLYLSCLSEFPGAPNLLRPIVAHAAYDYLAFLWIIHEYRHRTESSSSTEPTSHL
jgi:membrane protease YdiL (CAAX protease family)